jgi:hypothetical protein
MKKLLYADFIGKGGEFLGGIAAKEGGFMRIEKDFTVSLRYREVEFCEECQSYSWHSDTCPIGQGLVEN